MYGGYIYSTWLSIIVFSVFLQNRDTPLHLASKGGYCELVEILIKSGANIAVVNKVSYLRTNTFHIQ